MTHLGIVTVVVRDYDEAIASYRDIVGFDLLEDTSIEDEKANPGAVLSQSLRSAALQNRIGDARRITARCSGEREPPAPTTPVL
ncbi:VOC family protein [Streptomyces sp. NBC_01005]|uniref:VOC family protein n=1 Tax=unclassified Streptomyces TaxID=2593676 RepID=UPI00386307A9|nr:VOC family protein [Streptomyces sp. NBC_01005]WTC99586.1 VOC family protein [Streptomyces sp. NBC_01650]